MKVLVGGQAFTDRPDAWKHMAADALAQNAVDAAARLTLNGR